MNSPTPNETRRTDVSESIPGDEDPSAIVSDAIPADLVAASGSSAEQLEEIGRTYVTAVLPETDGERITEFVRLCSERGLSSDVLGMLLTELQARLVETAESKESLSVATVARVTGRDIAVISSSFAEETDGSGSASPAAPPEAVSRIHSQARQVTQRSTEIESLTEQQSSNMDELSREVGDISAAVEEIAASSDEINARSDDAADLAEEGCAKARALSERIDEIHARASRVHEAIDVLVEHIADIDEFVDTIDEIADQTNMLALNASIEAARVDGGEGFAVVADEVKSLAEDSQREAARIRELVATIDEATTRVTADIEGVSEQTEIGRRDVAQSVDTFEEIEAVTGRLSASMDEIATATGQQAQGTEELAMMADEANHKAGMILEEVNQIRESNHRLLERLETSLVDETPQP